MILLDTHIWVWAVGGEARRLGRRTRQLLARAERQGMVRVSPASVFEVSALHTLGRLRVARPIDGWIRDAVEASGLRVSPLSTEIAIDAGRIARTALADPLDRLLVATARDAEATLVSADERILAYAEGTGAVRVHDART